jgi:hypothetical protein
VAAVLPDASVDWRYGKSSFGYRVATWMPDRMQNEDTQAGAWLPEFSLSNGRLALERGLHQEIGWERKTDVSGMSVQVFADRVRNPVLEAMGRIAEGDSGSMPVAALIDRVSGLMRAAGPDFSSQGVVATFERRLPGGNDVRISYANGKALVMPALPQTAEIAQVLGAARPRRVQMYSISLSGILDGTGTRWRASYRWQPEDSVTEVAPFSMDASAPYLNLRLRQPIRLSRDGSNSFEALLDVRNMLAEGYSPVLLSDGSVLVFAQGQRSIGGGLAFTF